MLFVNGFVVMIMAEQPVVVFRSFFDLLQEVREPVRLVGDTQEVISLLDRELDAIRAAGEGGTVAHVLPEDELPMNATGLETLDSI